MTLCTLLTSEDIEIRKSAQVLMYSNLLFDPCSILRSFSSYKDYFISLPTRSETGSLEFSTMVIPFINSVLFNVSILTENDIQQILDFMIECLKACNSDIKSDSFALNAYNKTTYKKVLQVLFENISIDRAPKQFLDILGLLEIDDLMDLNSIDRDKLVKIISDDLDSYFLSLLRILQANCKTIISFASDLIAKTSLINQKIIKKLLPWQEYLIVISSSYKSEEISNLASILQDYDVNCIELEPPFPPDRLRIEDIAFCNSIFGNAEIDISSISNAKDVIFQKNIIKSLIKQNDEYQLVDKLRTMLPKPQEQQTVPKQNSRAETFSIKSLPKAVISQRLEESAFKLGGLGHSKWQRRFFQYYPNNKCLIWRKESAKGPIKGLIILEKSTEISVDLSASRGKPNRVTIKHSKKTHEIAFDSAASAKKWHIAMTTEI